MNNRRLRLKLTLCRHMIASDDAGLASCEDDLFNDCRGAVAPAAGVHEIEALLVELQQENRAIQIAGDVVRFAPTARGRAFVVENG
jgi:hypothetical protein